MDTSLELQQKKWLKLHYIAILLLMLYAVSGPLEPYDGTLVTGKLYISFVSVVFAFFFYFRRLNTVVEAKLFLLFAIWLFITRPLNSDFFLIRDFNVVFNVFFCYVVLDTGIMLEKKRRESLFDWISIASGVVFSIVGIMAITSALLQTDVVLPITGRSIGMQDPSFPRLYIYGTNPNFCGIWFALAATLMACQFIKCKHWFWRIPIVFAILINYFTLTLTFSRNCMLSLCFGFALLGMLVVMSWLKNSKRWLQISVGILTALILLAGVYKSFDLSAQLISKTSAALISAQNPASNISETLATPEDEALADTESIETASGQAYQTTNYTDERDLIASVSNMSNRLPIYLSTFYSFGQQPKRLFIGCADKDVMTISNTILPQNYEHLHNSYLQAFALTGIPGFLLIMAFFVLLVVRMVRLFFSEKEGVELWTKSLAAPLTGLLTYNCLETSMFHFYDYRVDMVFFLAGIMLGYYYDIYPAHKKQKNLKADISSQA